MVSSNSDMVEIEGLIFDPGNKYPERGVLRRKWAFKHIFVGGYSDPDMAKRARRGYGQMAREGGFTFLVTWQTRQFPTKRG